MFRLTFRSLTIILCLVSMWFFLCSKNPVVHIPLPHTGKTTNGYFYVLSPAFGDSIAFDSTIAIEWAASQKVPGSADVKLYLYNDTHQVSVISPSSANTGSLTWSVPNSGTGTKFRIKISVLPDTQNFDFSDYFSLYSPYYGTITLTKPDSTSRLILDSSFTITWSVTGYPGSRVKLSLYDTAFVSTIVDGMMTAVHSYSWSRISSSHGSGTGYRIKATSDFDSSICGYSQYFTISSPYWGGFTIQSPSDTTVWSSGASVKVLWDTAGHPGSSVIVQLYNDTTLLSTMASSVPDSGAFRWSVPLTTTSGTKYCLKITSTGDASLFAFSKKFAIKGIDPDAFEPDNSRDSASALTFGTSQKHTITQGDTDWVRFTADSGSRYIISDSGVASFLTAVPLFYAKEPNFTSYNFTNGSGLLLWMWPCEKTGTYYTQISALVPGNTGAYSFKIAKYDSSTLAAFTAPTSSSTAPTGASFTIEWKPDSAILGANVYLYLYKGNTLISNLTPSSVPDNGSFSWIVPAGFASGSDYRIRIANSGNSLFYGMSPLFTLTGMAPDTFEYDDVRDSASLLSAGIAQQHSLTLGDTDWIRLAPDSGSTYLFQVKGVSSFQTTIDLFHGTETGISSMKFSDSSGSAIWLWTIDKSGPWYARVNASNAGNFGAYSFRMTKFDSLSSIAFTSPAAVSKWFGAISYTIAWTPDTGILGPAVSLHLVKSGIQSSVLSVSSAPNSGTYSWLVPAGVTPGGDYRIRIANAANPSLFGLSPQFSISDVMPDSFEVDDTRGQATLLSIGTVQQHSLTVADTDWIRFAADSGSRYVIAAGGTAGFMVSGALYSNTNPMTDAVFTSGTNGIMQSLWTCTKTGSCYAKVFSNSIGATGRYSFKAQLFDSSTIVPFTSPAASIQWSTDSTYTIRWTPDTILFGKQIFLYAYEKDLLSATITATSASNAGSYSWTVPSGFSTGTDYRIRIVNASNTQMYGMSPVFSIKGMTPDAYEPDNPRSLASSLVFGTPQQHTITYGDTDWVRFSADSGSSYFIRDTGASAFRTYVYLYYNTDAAATSSNYSLATGRLVWVWSCVKTGTYYAQVTPYITGTAGAYSFSATKFDTLASITFTSPVSSSAFTAGNTSTITWVPDTSILGTNAYLYLYKAGQMISTISASYVPNSGAYSWTSSSGLFTGNDYRIKIVSYANSRICGYSAAFTINGLSPDSYEPDNGRSQASTLTLGTTQQHTITPGDTDWVQFSADSGSVYVLKDSGASLFRTYVYLYYGTDLNYTAFNNPGASGTLTWYWTCAKTGTYSARITPYMAATYGSYSFKVSLYDPFNSIVFTNPISTSAWTAGTSAALGWVPDSLILGTSVYLYVFKGGQQLASIASSAVPNSGGYSWPIPSGIATGNDYRIKIANSFNGLQAGYSQVFSISGTVPDSYEPDNIRSQASTLTLGAAQQHTITYNDTDWVTIPADSGSMFIIKDSGTASFRTYVHLFNGTDASFSAANFTSASGTLSWQWTCLKGGTWYARIEGYAPGTGGTYSLAVTRFDTITSITFTNPTAASSWTAGSSATIGWVPDTSVFGSQVNIFICKGFQAIGAVTASPAADNGNYAWTLPSGLATGNDYRIKIVSVSQPGLSCYSPAFSISGATPDAYENDNSRATASSLVFGAVQLHTITYNDTDWIQFSGQAGSKYMVSAMGASSYRTSTRLFNGANTTASFADSAKTTGNMKSEWDCQTSDTWYARITGLAGGSGGSYSFKINKFDSLTTASITFPTAGAALVAGHTYTITWKPDSVFFDTSVLLYLYQGQNPLVPITHPDYNVTNNGSYTCKLDSAFPSGNNFQIRMISYPDYNFTSYSPVFSISGTNVSPDAYEPDSLFRTAKPITLGATQQHTITLNDLDVVQFPADSGSTYLITGGCSAPFAFYCQIYSGPDTIISGSFIGQAPTYSYTWNCLQTGACFLEYQTWSMGDVGNYSIRVTKQ